MYEGGGGEQRVVAVAVAVAVELVVAAELVAAAAAVGEQEAAPSGVAEAAA